MKSGKYASSTASTARAWQLLGSILVVLVLVHLLQSDSSRNVSFRRESDAKHKFLLQSYTERTQLEASEQPRSHFKSGRVAICLAGGLRTFELTGLSLAQHLFPAYAPADIFFFAPLDENSYKLVLIREEARRSKGLWKIKGVTFLAQEPLDESSEGAQILKFKGSPNAVQGLLQYFQLVEGCHGLIEEAERTEGFSYDWIIRTRPDGFWTGPPPPLSQLSPLGYSFPEGSSWGGINDRFGAARGVQGKEALRRLSALRPLAKREVPRTLNSETSLKRHLAMRGIPLNATQLPFCTVSPRYHGWPLRSAGLPVFAMSTTAPMNAAKCRPCEPVASGKDAIDAMRVLNRNIGLPYTSPSTSGVYQLCDARGPWSEDWPELFDASAGEEGSAFRLSLKDAIGEDCQASLQALLSSVQSYKGPGADVLCSIQELGPVIARAGKNWNTVNRIKSALGKPHPFVAWGFPSLSVWDRKKLSLPPKRVVEKCNPCFMVLRLHGHEWAMSTKKPVLVKKIKEAGWDALKCGGMHEKQVCLFLHLKE